MIGKTPGPVSRDWKERPSSPPEALFDRVAPRYDLLNRLLSFGLDPSWRRHVVSLLPSRPGQRALDLATGTADQALALASAGGRFAKVIGLDVSSGMLDIGRRKVAARGLTDRVELVAGDAEAIPLPDASFDAVTMSFGIRNAAAREKVLKEMLRVLVPGGRAVILEFSLPGARLWRWPYLAYLRLAVPALGALLAGNAAAYRYLGRSIEAFPSPKEFERMMESAGFAGVEARPLTLGVVTAYQGERPLPPT